MKTYDDDQLIAAIEAANIGESYALKALAHIIRRDDIHVIAEPEEIVAEVNAVVAAWHLRDTRGDVDAQPNPVGLWVEPVPGDRPAIRAGWGRSGLLIHAPMGMGGMVRVDPVQGEVPDAEWENHPRRLAFA